MLADVKQEAEEDESLLNNKKEALALVGAQSNVAALAGGALTTRRAN